MKLRIFLTVLLVSFLFTNKSVACGYFVMDWENRPMSFRATLPSMNSMKPFWYTTASIYHSMLPDPLSNDRGRNVSEWQKATSSDVTYDDIYNIQYETSPDAFVSSYQTTGLKDWAKTNTLIAYLLKNKKHKDILEYLVFAKEMEYSEQQSDSSPIQFEEWSGTNGSGYGFDKDQKGRLLERAEKKFKEVKSPFLKDRYAFQIVRLGWQTGNTELSVNTFKSHFGEVKPDNLMSAWAGMFCAMSLDQLGRRPEANRMYIHAFDNCDEKKLRCMQLYNDTVKVPDWFTAKEKSVDAVMRSIKYPGRELERMQQIYALDKSSKYMTFLVMREVCKVEDWLLSTVYWKSEEGTLGCKPNETSDYQKWWYDVTSKKNQETDLKYLARLKDFILQLKTNANRQSDKDYYAIALTHLSLLEENKPDALKYMSEISSKADESIKIQKAIEDAWILLKTEDVTTNRFKTQYLEKLKLIRKHLPEEDKDDRSADPCYENSRIYFTLNLALANEFYEKGDIVSMCLLKTAYDFEEGYPKSYEIMAFASNYYSGLRLFDMYASTSDMDKLIALIEKKDKTDFEKFLCNQPLNKIDSYKDLKGTIAFRNNDLKLAYETFASMDQQFWKDNYMYSMYLNEDPFVPKGIKQNRDFTYEFNKTQFVKLLIDLEATAQDKNKEKAADAYLKLAHAYYNTTYLGNSWMMMTYGWSTGGDYYTLNPKKTCSSAWLKNYNTPIQATDYYQKAYNLTRNKEIKAYATLMLVNCYSFIEGDDPNSKLSVKYANEYDHLYYGHTLFDKQNECLGYAAFVK